jgi:hypothetical protein
MNKLIEKALELAKAKHQVIGRGDDYYITLEQLNKLVEARQNGKARWIEVDGTITEIAPNNGKSFTLEELQGFVREGDENTIGIAYMPSGLAMVYNDNGKLIGLPVNDKATEIWKKEYPIAEYPHNNDELIVGNVLIATAEQLGDGEEDEETV